MIAFPSFIPSLKGEVVPYVNNAAIPLDHFKTQQDCTQAEQYQTEHKEQIAIPLKTRSPGISHRQVGKRGANQKK